jgi:hypothetical protein
MQCVVEFHLQFRQNSNCEFSNRKEFEISSKNLSCKYKLTRKQNEIEIEIEIETEREGEKERTIFVEEIGIGIMFN